MSDKFLSEYYAWQNRFINAYKDSNTNSNFLQKMAIVHPGITENLSTEKKISFISSRMKNYNRRCTLKDGSVVYERTPYIDDLFAFCKAKGITPNEVLLDSLRDTVSNFRKFTDIYDLFNMKMVGVHVSSLQQVVYLKQWLRIHQTIHLSHSMVLITV